MITVLEEMSFSNLNFAPSNKLTNAKESFTVSPFTDN